MNELLINGQSLDLSDSTNIGITFSANNIGELQNRQSNFSNTFKVPITKRNSEILEWSHIQISSSQMPYRKNNVTYIQDGVELVAEGFAEVVGVDNGFYSLNVYSGNFDFIDSIGNLTVGELFEDDIVYNWTLLNAMNYRAGNDYFVYPLIDWRKDIDTYFASNGTIDVRQMLPCVMIKKMFDRLSQRVKFNLTGAYLRSDVHDNMILSLNNFEKLQPPVIRTSQQLTEIDFPVGNGTISSGNQVSNIFVYPIFRNEGNNPEFAWGDYRPQTTTIGSLKFSGTYRAVWDIGYKKINAGSFTVVSEIIDDLGAVLKTESKTYESSQSTDDNTEIREFYDLIPIDIETDVINFSSARRYSIRLTFNITQRNRTTFFSVYNFRRFAWFPTQTSSTLAVTTDVFERSLEFTETKAIGFGTPLNFPDLFTMKVKDVLKDILNMRGIIIQTNNYTKTVQFNFFQDLKNNISNAIDWSSKLQTKSISMGFKFGNYAKVNNMQFKEDSDKDLFVIDKSKTSFTIDNETLENEKLVVQLLHPATVVESRFNYYSIPVINQLKDANNEFLKNDWRLLQLSKQDTSFNVNYTDGVTTAPLTQVIPFCKFVPFEDLKNAHYTALIESLNQAKVLKADFNLNATDINNLDFTIPIYLDVPSESISGYFYLNKIENYKGNITKCEIIRL